MRPSGVSRWDDREVDVLAREWDVPVLEAYDRIGSTNDRALELAEERASAWSVVVADEQTRGRGRRGSSWVSGSKAGLWMSVVAGDVEVGAPLPLRVGLACAEAIESLLPDVEVSLKWPNDLMLDGRKVGGILCEAVGDAVVVGIGINIGEAPDGAFPAAALEVASSNMLSRSDLASAIIDRLRAMVTGLSDPGVLGEEALSELRRRDALAGAAVRTDQEGPGRASGIDRTGALLLTRDDGEEVRVVSGSVRLWSSGRAGGPAADPA